MTATPELMGAVERKARELGVWVPVDTAEDWAMSSYPGGTFILSKHDPDPQSSDEHDLDPLTAALWLLLHAAGLTVERSCPGCEGTKRSTHWDRGGGGFDEPEDEPCRECSPSCGCSGYELLGYGDIGDCSACGGGGRLDPTGRVHIEAARVLLDAMPTMVEPCCTGEFVECCCEGRVQEDWGGVREARDDLDVLSHRLFDLGDPLAHALALWLRGELREEHVMGACKSRTLDASTGEWVHELECVVCYGCDGTNVVLEARPA